MIKYLCLPVLLLACAADPAPAAPPRLVSATVRYQAEEQSLEATVQYPDSLTTAPTFLGSSVPRMGDRLFRSRRTLPFPKQLALAIPRGDEFREFRYDFLPPTGDSLPALVDRERGVSFTTGTDGLTADESLIVFFEPVMRSRPHRILVTGPTAGGTVTLPASAVADIPPGDYGVYLVKQQLHRDSTDGLRVSIQTEYFTGHRPVRVE